jgi:PBP1b-binding outer membrane lipoprotein LpoB
MVSRENQQELVQELRLRQSDIYDPQTIGRLGRQLGAQYFVTGKVTSVEERFKRTRRVQYSLILQVLEVETGLIVFQNEATRSKALKG